jgi:hypothetical protein
MANVNYDFQKRERERAKLAKKAAKARDKAATLAHSDADVAPDPGALDRPLEAES